jgi:hypothetical protein
MMANEPWAVSDLLFGLESEHDDEGRPVGERRAPSSAKIGVPMELKPCPYRDERRGLPMNVSALAQITRHLDTVLDDISAFRAAQGHSSPSWMELLEVVIDQLFGPGRHAILEGDTGSAIPARLAVGHKLAAGFFGVLGDLIAAELAGRGRPPSVDSFLDYVSETRALQGGSEVCGGPPVMIAKATRVLFHGSPSAAPLVDESRLVVARLLAEQVRYGIAWKQLDQAFEYDLLAPGSREPTLMPRNDFIARKLGARRDELAAWEAITPVAALESLRRLVPQATSWDGSVAERERAVAMVSELVLCGDGALIAGDAIRGGFAARVLDYLTALRATMRAQQEREAPLRSALGQEDRTPFRCNAQLLPLRRALKWMEAVLGYHIECPARGAVVLSQPGRETTEISELAF